MKTDKTSKNAAYTGLFAAIAASSCCIPPFIALIAGVGGSASSLSWIEPFRPYLIGIAVIAIGYAWYNYLKPKDVDSCGCSTDKPKWYQTKSFLVGITLFSILSISFPYYAAWLYPNQTKNSSTVNQNNMVKTTILIDGMTCDACQSHIDYEINKLPGIVSTKTSYKNKNTTVSFDKTKTNINQIKKAINNTGYQVKN